MKYNTLFISDIHLGTSNCQVDKLLDFLSNNTFNKIYLVGDIIDMIMMKRKFYWKKKHNKVIQNLLKISKNTEVIYIIGNHDIFLETFIDEKFGNILVKETDIHISKKGEKCLVLHGHQFDGALMTYTWLYWLGSAAYDLSLLVNRWYNKFRTKMLKKEYWSLSMYLKSKTKEAIKFINNFEELVSDFAKKENVDIVIAGHIHMKEDKYIKEVRYMNCGCWTEFTSCIVETIDGELKILDI
jgi:UDP-2,3-diacylglucosamine pyrophosphatase LpxH